MFKSILMVHLLMDFKTALITISYFKKFILPKYITRSLCLLPNEVS